MQQSMFHTVIHLRKVGDFLFLAGRWQILKESAVLCGFRFIPPVFQNHLCQLLTVKELLYPIILESAE